MADRQLDERPQPEGVYPVSSVHSEDRGVYLDHQASTPLDPSALDAMRAWFLEEFGNPHASEHAYGWRAAAAVEQARAQIAAVIGAEPPEIIFTSGATEANNLAIIGAARRADPRRREIIVSAIEHPSVLSPTLALREQGFRIHTIPVSPSGMVRLDMLEEHLSERVALVSIGAVNNEIGTIQPIEQIGRLCRGVGALYHSDGAQSLLALRVNLYLLPIDLMSFSGHKIHGPKGIGALYVASDTFRAVEPLLYGGGQERGLRPGTLPTALCVGFGLSANGIHKSFESIRDHLRTMSTYLFEGLRRLRPDIQLNGIPSPRHPGNLNILIPGADAADLIQRLQPNVACSTGSACSSGSIEVSHVLTALGLSADDARASLRLSVGRLTTKTEIDKALSHFARCFEESIKSLWPTSLAIPSGIGAKH